MKFNAVYIEITNICNLKCSFCIGTNRAPKFLSADEFSEIAEKVRPYTDYIYLHVMGEPLLNPNLEQILTVAEKHGFKVNITTNGTLIDKKTDILLNCKALRKISVSLHSFEGNNSELKLVDYLTSVWNFYKKSSCIFELRLWNEGGKNSRNDEIEAFFSEKTNTNTKEIEEIKGSRKISDRLYISTADVFEWPSLTSQTHDTRYCYALKTHFAILCDGTVIPCCLDSNGTLALGNIFTESLEKILSSERAKSIVNGFSVGKPSEELCRKCGFASKYRQ